MSSKVSFFGKQVIIRTDSLYWKNPDKIFDSELYTAMLHNYLLDLRNKDSDFIKIFPTSDLKEQERLSLLLMKTLSKYPREDALKIKPELKSLLKDIYTTDQFVENFYNFWRKHERFLVTESNDFENGNEDIDKRPYRIFNDTIEQLNHLVRKIYRDIRENTTGEHPIIYRQVPAGCQVGVIATQKETLLPDKYNNLNKIKIIRQVLIEPPLIINPPNNKRKGVFKLVDSNPIEGFDFTDSEWLCFPAKVGELVIYLYFHSFYTNIAISTANLFELCTDEDLKKRPDGIYAFGVTDEQVAKFAPDKTVYFEDTENGIMVGAIPIADEFGYFGYVKKMMLTLYNSIMIRRGRMPVHGAMTRITMKNGKEANVIIFGDTGTGKSESLEAFRSLSADNLKDLKIIFDDMGSLEVTKDGKIKAFGTETGAFVRLDDLDAGYAFGNIDRSIIMSAHMVNARAVLPITTLEDILYGYEPDYFLYANNYEEVTDGNYISFFSTPEEAMKVFKEGKRMAKGTTNEKGLVGAYYANVFGPTQLMDAHEPIAKKTFNAMFKTKIKVGMIKTQLGIPGKENNGPKNAAQALFNLILKK